MQSPLWLELHSAQRRPTARLYVLPYAGGSAAAMRRCFAAPADDAAFLAAEYPGHGSRWETPLCNHVTELVDDFMPSILARGDQPFALFGYSFGALVAFELARALSRRGRPPLALVVLAAKAPHLVGRGTPTHGLNDANLLARLRLLGGTPDELLGNAGLMEWVLPVLRADLHAYDTYRPTDLRALACPVIAIRGADDPFVSHGDARSWLRYGAPGASRLYTLPGGHFCHYGAQPTLSSLIGTLFSIGDRRGLAPAEASSSEAGTVARHIVPSAQIC
ncbi:MAG: thioesterase II family protein [Burkholderiales bacterium]